MLHADFKPIYLTPGLTCVQGCASIGLLKSKAMVGLLVLYLFFPVWIAPRLIIEIFPVSCTKTWLLFSAALYLQMLCTGV